MGKRKKLYFTHIKGGNKRRMRSACNFTSGERNGTTEGNTSHPDIVPMEVNGNFINEQSAFPQALDTQTGVVITSNEHCLDHLSRNVDCMPELECQSSLEGVAAEVQIYTSEVSNECTNIHNEFSFGSSLTSNSELSAVDLVTPPNETSTSPNEFMFPTENLESEIPAIFLESVNKGNEEIRLRSTSVTTSISCASVEVIDVDELPDRPDSPVGDEVVEILPPEPISQHNTRSHRRYIDLTDQQEGYNLQTTSNDDESNSSSITIHQSDGGESTVILKTNTVSPSWCSSGTTSSNTVTTKNIKTISISCPICMDDAAQITESNRQLISTPCGHIFCDACVNNALKTNTYCPTCRKKIQKKRLHPIFI